jgi:phosphoglucosamine mutase
MRTYFGTDGIRGQANSWPMTPDIVMRLGMAAGLYFRRGGERRHSVVIGKDTRLSGYMIEPALVAGFTAVGMDVVLFGPMPTPGVAMMTRSLRADLGVMISASHNTYSDNGIKLFGPDGFKLSDAIELEIEGLMDSDLAADLSPPNLLGRAKRIDDAQSRYVEIVKASFPRGQNLKGLRIVIDCANGAAYKVAPQVLWELGAEVFPVGVEPNGFNINLECGSTDPRAMREAVQRYRADVGIALDGDADRLILCDEAGRIIDGDQVLGLIATDWKARHLLAKPAIVATVMSNLGLEKHLARQGIELIRTKVGDRYVVERMRADGYNVGGEQSGHLVLSDHSTTGDGLMAALQVLAVLKAQDKPFSALAKVFQPAPQVLKNVRLTGPDPSQSDAIKTIIAAAETRLGATGRLLVRKSGTEPVVRVMAEGEDEALVRQVVDEVAAAFEAAR